MKYIWKSDKYTIRANYALELYSEIEHSGLIRSNAFEDEVVAKASRIHGHDFKSYQEMSKWMLKDPFHTRHHPTIDDSELLNMIQRETDGRIFRVIDKKEEEWIKGDWTDIASEDK